MPILSVTVRPTPVGPYESGATVTLKATVSPAGDHPFRWLKDGKPANDLGTGKTLKLSVTGDTKGVYAAQVTPTENWDDAVTSSPVTLALKATADTSTDPQATQPPAAGSTEKPEQLLFSRSFAAAAAAVLMLVGVLALWSPARAIGRFGWGDSKTPADVRVADVGSVIGLGLLVIGALALLAGIWMALVELRGRMRLAKDLQAQPGRARGGIVETAPGIIDAIGKLKGPTAVLVVGCIPLLAAAWIGRGAVERPVTSTTTTSTTLPEGTSPTPGSTAVVPTTVPLGPTTTRR